MPGAPAVRDRAGPRPNGIRGLGPARQDSEPLGGRDLDVIIYSARKWARLALAGNPTVLLVLFAPDEEVVFRNDVGAELVSNAHRFVPGSPPVGSWVI